MDFSSDGLAMGGHSVHLREESGLAQDRLTIDELPDDVLVEIFFYANIEERIPIGWHTLVHVCRRWRCLVFASPRRLNLRLGYAGHRPMSEVLDAWPNLPISLMAISGRPCPSNKQQNNIVALLESEHYNRICEINIWLTNSHWERFKEAMQKSFPPLTDLRMRTRDVVPVLPESFLAGSAPRLRILRLCKIPLPSIPKLLLSAHRLVQLYLWFIPDSGYFSPDALATSLTVMTRLEYIRLVFDSPRSRPESRSPPPPTRFVLPALTRLEFKGVYEYLEDLLAPIDAPLLNKLQVDFLMDLEFDVPQLHRFIAHAELFKTFDCADVWITKSSIRLCVFPNTMSGVDRRKHLELRINCRESDYQISALAQVCSSSFPPISTLEELEIAEDGSLSSSHWKDDMEDAQWLELLDPFTALKNLYLPRRVAQRFCDALRELSGERATEVLPALRNLFVLASLKPIREAMKPFIAARQLSGHPVVVDRWGG